MSTSQAPSAPLMLGVSGMRGIIGQSLTPDVAARFAAALATWLARMPRPRSKRPAVILGMDGRRGGDIFLHTAAQALRAAGCDVLNAGTVMTPTIGVLVDAAGADAGLIITASHNPQSWNGLKIVLRDARTGNDAPPAVHRRRRSGASASAPPASLAAEIIEIYRSGDFAWRGPDDLGEYLPRSATFFERHEQLLLNILKETGDLQRIRRRKYTVALDTVGGAGGIWVPRFLEALGCRVHELYPVIKTAGSFPHTPEPTRENLVALCRAAKRHKADIGLAVDPDGDRLAIVDHRGRYIGEEYTLALTAESLLSARASAGRRPRGRKGPPLLMTNLSTSRMLDDIAARYDANVVRTPVGEANVVEAMKREAAAGHEVVLGGEGNGGVIWHRVTYIRDSLSAMALVLALMARSRRSVADLVAAIPAYAIEKRKVDLARRDDAAPAIEKLARSSRESGVWALRENGETEQVTVDLQDGIRLDFPAARAWLHVRPSNTEPIMRLIAEAPTSELAQKILSTAAREIG